MTHSSQIKYPGCKIDDRIDTRHLIEECKEKSEKNRHFIAPAEESKYSCPPSWLKVRTFDGSDHLLAVERVNFTKNLSGFLRSVFTVINQRGLSGIKKTKIRKSRAGKASTPSIQRQECSLSVPIKKLER